MRLFAAARSELGEILSAPEFFDALANHAPNHIDAFDPQGLANSVWAYATAGAATGAARDSTRERRVFFIFLKQTILRRGHQH